jgi:hypothetical protein
MAMAALWGGLKALGTSLLGDVVKEGSKALGDVAT